ncbi:MAG: hypothetical protein A2W25_04930 [candidate division Zixibacteria bacterium RBG_16_53_22]|nr:MAG: hypothetical protein A2W25_04930 [candidate division Zixibacteria bacterium RBG_16_53_22]
MAHKDTLVKYVISVALALAGLLSGYYAAYTGLRVELATKAEGRYVDDIDIRLARMEAMINERFATREDLAGFKNEIVSRLTAIETKLANSE